MTVEVNFRWGHLDRMPRCQHGRVVCGACEEDRTRRCRWCRDPVTRGVPCGCDRAQKEMASIRAGTER